MKFGEIIDIFDNSGRLMLVATYKRSRKLNKTKMMEVTKEMKKIKKIMSMVLVIATLFTTFSQTVQASPVKMNTISNGIEMVEKNFTETSIYAKYYLTVNGKTMLYTEYGEIENNNFVLDTTSVEVDKDKKEISSTEQTEHVVTPILLYNNTESFISLYAYNYKAHTETFNLKFDKWTLGAVTTVLVATIGLAAGDAGVIAGALIDSVADGLIPNIPDSIYFDGERCVSHSSGKIYYRYRGDFYSDSSEKVLLKKNVSWSRRWGH